MEGTRHSRLLHICFAMSGTEQALKHQVQFGYALAAAFAEDEQPDAALKTLNDVCGLQHHSLCTRSTISSIHVAPYTTYA